MRELTFNLTEDKRYLVEPTNVENFNLTFDKPNWVQGRVGEDSLRQVFVNVVTGPNNEPYDLTGINPEFDGLTAKGGPENRNYVVIDNHHSVMIDAQGGRFRFDFPKEAFAIAGSYKQAFFSLKREGTGEVVATLEFDMKVMANFVYEGVVAFDYVTPFEDLYHQLEQIIETANGDITSKLAEWQTTFQNKYNELTQLGIDTTNALATAQARLNDLAAQIEAKDLFTKSEAEAWQNSVKKDLTSINGVNVMEFGAVADGQFDNVNAISDAVAYAKEHNINAVYFPAGTYFTTGHDVVIAGMKVSGAGRDQSILVKDVSEPFFELRTDSRVTGLRFYDKSSDQSSILTVNNKDGISSSWSIEIDHCWLMGDESQGNQHGDWNTTAINFDLNHKGLWDVHLHDNIIYWVDYGVKVDTTNSGWFTGSVFHDLTIKGFSVAAMALMSSDKDGQQISQLSISDIIVETLYKNSGNTTAVGFIISGRGNTFSGLQLFKDGAYSGIAIRLENFNDLTNHPGWFGGSRGSTYGNVFVGGNLEGTISDPDGVYDLQIFKALETTTSRVDDNEVITTLVNTSQKIDLVSDEMVRNSMYVWNVVTNPGKAKISTGTDVFGKYVQIETSSGYGFFNIPFIDPAGTALSLDNADYFTTGLKFRSIDGIETSPIYRQTVRFNETEYPSANKNYWREQRIGDLGLTERIEIYSRNPDFWQSASVGYHRFDSLWAIIQPNRKLRIYDGALVSGRTTSLSNVVRNNVLNGTVEGGGTNLILDSSKSFVADSSTTINSTKVMTMATNVEVLNWHRGNAMTMSFDLNAHELNTESVTSRLGLYLAFDITFEDNSTTSFTTGLVSGIHDAFFRDRVFSTFQLPDKAISTASASMVITQGTKFNYLQFGRPQLETGSKAHDYKQGTTLTTALTSVQGG
ncbi:MAG: BppU family phage baseplate upper protein [Limosilactobacillus sp.]|nr:BppU family phage baseplate upper protein [Limosilactobacillus sp.]